MSAPALANGVRFRREADGKGSLLIPEGIVNLNQSAAAILELVDGRRSIADIAGTLATQYGADEADIASDVESLVQRLVAKTWLILSVAEKS